jgi:hypothetical protein
MSLMMLTIEGYLLVVLEVREEQNSPLQAGYVYGRAGFGRKKGFGNRIEGQP